MSDEIWIYIYIFVACNRWVRTKKKWTTVSLSIRRLYPHHLRKMTSLIAPRSLADASKSQQITHKILESKRADLKPQPCHVVAMCLPFWSFCFSGSGVSVCMCMWKLHLSLSLALYLSLSLPISIYLYIVCKLYLYIYIEYISNQASFHSVSTRQKLSYFEWSHPDTLFWHSFWQSFGSICMESILTLFLAFYPASSLTFCLTYFMASILTLFLASIMALYLASILTFYLTFFLANTLTFLQSIWHLFWQASLLADVPRRAPQHPALSIWLGSIGAHSHAEIRRAGRGSRRRLY